MAGAAVPYTISALQSREDAALFVTGLKYDVLDRQDAATLRAIETRDAAISIMNDMAGFMPRMTTGGVVPKAPVLAAQVDATLNIEPIRNDSLGTISPVNRADVALDAIADLANPTLVPFNPDFSAIQVPEAPAQPAGRIAPTHDDFGTVTLPPDFVMSNRPNVPELLALNLPTFTPIDFPLFAVDAPLADIPAVNTVLQWAESQYDTSTLAEIQARLKNIMDSEGLGIPPAVEQALWERAAAREDLAVNRDVSAAYVEYATRGFSSPPGMVAARTDAVRAEGQIRKLGLQREITIKVAETQVENFKFACTQTLAAEQALVNIWDVMAKRQFEAHKLTLDSQLAFYNAQVNLFNAQQQAYSTEANVYKIKIDGELAKLSAYKAQLEGEIAKGQVNEQNIKVYSEQYRAIAVEADVYKARMQGAAVQGEAIKSKVDAYRAEVEAFATLLQTDKLAFDIYDSRVKGELGKAQVLASQVQAYGQYVQGEALKVDVVFKNNQARIAKNEHLIHQFAANIEKDKAMIIAQQAAVQANAEAFKVNVDRFRAQAGVEQAQVELEIKATEANMARTLQLYDVEVKRYISDMEQMIRVSQAQLEAMKSAGQIAGTLAAGAMAGISISSGISGQGSTGISTSRADTESHNVSNNASLSFEALTDPRPI